MPSPVAWLGFAALAGITAFGVFTAGNEARQTRPVMETLDGLALSLGFGIGQVEISGHKFTSDRHIHDTLDLGNVRSLLRFDSAAVRQRIERLPWIETVAVTRIFPDRLQIAVTERAPFARWRHDDRLVLIDRTGRVLAQAHAGAGSNLPLVTGQGAAEAAHALMSLIEAYPAIGNRLEAAERVDGRRWALHLDGGPTLHLPADGEAAALDRLTAAGVLQAVAATAATVVDLRVPGRLIVRRNDAGAAPPPTVRSQDPDQKSAAPGIGKEKQGAQRG